MAKSQPKVADIAEILLQEVEFLNRKIKQNTDTQVLLNEKISNLKVPVDTSALESIQKIFYVKTQHQIDSFFREIKKGTETFSTVNKLINSKALQYLILINLILLVGFVISVYIAVNSSVAKSDYNAVVMERDLFDSKLQNITEFFTKNPSAKKSYIKWNENSAK